MEVANLGDVFERYVRHLAGGSVLGQASIPSQLLGERGPQAVTVDSAHGSLTAQLPNPSRDRVLDLKRQLAMRLGVPAASVVVYPAEESKEAVRDEAYLGLRVQSLWVTYPKEDPAAPAGAARLGAAETVAVICQDPLVPQARAEVRVGALATLSEVRKALLDEHCAAATREQVQRVKLAKQVNSAFVALDGSDLLGDERTVLALGLAGALGLRPP